VAIDSPAHRVYRRLPRLDAEGVVTLAGTLLSAVMLVLTAVYAGPLWRDEVNTANVAQMPWRELWRMESFPPLWTGLLHVFQWLGFANSDTDIRVLGLYVGLFFLGALWAATRWLGCRAPVLSVALLGCLPAMIFILGSNRAYGLGCGLLVLSFGLLWRVVERPSLPRVFWAGWVCLLFTHCLYYNVVFLGSMLAGGALVAVRRQRWKLLGALAGIGIVCAGSLAVYLPVIRSGSSDSVAMMRWPSFSFQTMWNALGDAVTLRSSGEIGRIGPEIWLWLGLLLFGLVTAALAQRKSHDATAAQNAGDDCEQRADRALFCGVSVCLGVAGMLFFLFRLRYWPESWYYVGMLSLCAISLDGLLGANWPALRPWGWCRLGFLLAMTAVAIKPAWQEAHTRRSNLDLVAAILSQNASAQDLVVVETAWEGITFDRYYRGTARWLTVPPIDAHKTHRNDLVFKKMNQPEAMLPVLNAVAGTLQSGHHVWLVGRLSGASPVPPDARQPKELGAYVGFWTAQLSTLLLNHAAQEQVVPLPARPVSWVENLPLLRFSGYKP
jgi:hypothetical protein